jgi:hypothetical protein
MGFIRLATLLSLGSPRIPSNKYHTSLHTRLRYAFLFDYSGS